MKHKILIVDDEKTIRFTLSSFLTGEGHEVTTAEDYAGAMTAIAETSFDVIIADIILGGKTGIDILREVRQRGLSSLLIIITGKPDIDTAAQSVRLGAFDYIPKPVRKETIIRVTDAALQYKAMEDEKRRREAEKERSRCSLEATFKSIKDAIVSVDAAMRVIDANDAFLHICGMNPEGLPGKAFDEEARRCAQTCLKTIRETLETKNTIKEFSIECRHQDRPLQVVTMTSSPLVDSAGQFQGAALVISDVTSLSDLAQEELDRQRFQDIIGKSPGMQDLYRLLEYLADTDTTVLITGESGTGKELVAEALHKSGPRAAKPQVKVNCSALSETLLESELFGHVKGAFTGAIKDKVGRFELAEGGTILLDEIGDISPGIQLKLLRVLQEKEFERVGDSTPVSINVRVMASTNRDLRERVSRGQFREDLYYRLKVVEVKIPPLRERTEDIPLLVDHFFNLFSRKIKKTIRTVSDEVHDLFRQYRWPGNVRELEHAMEHAFILCQGQTITLEHLPPEIRNCPRPEKPAAQQKHTEKPGEILQALEKAGWNKAKAARLLGISRPTLYQLIEKFNLAKPPEKV